MTSPLVAVVLVVTAHGARGYAADHGYEQLGPPGFAADFVSGEVRRGLLAALIVGLALSLTGLAAGARRRAVALVAYAFEASFCVLFLWLWRDWRHARLRGGRELPEFLWRPTELATALGLCALIALLMGIGLWKMGRAGRAAAWPGRWAVAGAWLATLFVALACLALRPWRTISAPRRPSVLFVSWDSTRADHLSRDLGVRGLSRQVVTIAETLRAAGFRTEALVQNPNLTPEWNFDQGFDRYVQGHEYLPSSEFAQQACRSLERLAAGDRPFYLFVHMMEPHFPYRPDGAHVSEFTAAAQPLLSESQVSALMARRAWLEDFVDSDVEGARRWLLDMYDSAIRDADDGLRILLDGLRRSGRLDDTLVVFNSDHGDEFQERGSWGHGHANVHPELTRIPLVLRFPAAMRVAPHRSQQLVGNLDVLPTILDTLELSPWLPVSGHSLVPRGESSDRSLLSYRAYLVAVRTLRQALVRDFSTEQGARVYDLLSDPQEWSPLSLEPDGSGPGSVSTAAVGELEAQAQAWFEDEHGGVVMTPGSEPREGLSED